MILKKKIQNDLVQAVRQKEELKTSVLRMLSASILNREKEKRYKLSREEPDLKTEDLERESQLTDEEIIEVIFFEIKKRKEAILEYEKGERKDLAEKEEKEMAILQEYLPEQLSAEDLKKLAQEAIKKVAAIEIKDMGKVMAELMLQVKGRAEGGAVSKIVKELLTPFVEEK